MTQETFVYEYDTQEVIALAYAAYRTNNGYKKDTRRYSEDRSTTWSNKELIRYSLQNEKAFRPSDFEDLIVTEEDRKNASEIDKHFKRYTFQILGNSLSDFQKDVYAAINVKTIPINKIGLIAYVPELINRELKDLAYKHTIKNSYSESQHLNEENINDVVTILKMIPLTAYDTNLYVGGVGKDLVSFSKTKELEVGENYEITARVKGHDKERDTGTPITRLNYVKLKKAKLNEW